MLTTPTKTLSNIPTKLSARAQECLDNRDKLAALLTSKLPSEWGADKYKLLSEIVADPEVFYERFQRFAADAKRRIWEFDNPATLVWGSVPTASRLGLPQTTFRRIVSELQIPSDCVADGKPAYSHKWISKFEANRYLLKLSKKFAKDGKKDLSQKKLQEFAAAMRPQTLKAKPTKAEKPVSLAEIL